LPKAAVTIVGHNQKPRIVLRGVCDPEGEALLAHRGGIITTLSDAKETQSQAQAHQTLTFIRLVVDAK
jgi:hypothetical protein